MTAHRNVMFKIQEYDPIQPRYNRRIFAPEWERHKDKLRQLYEQRLTRKEILEVIATELNFKPSMSQLNAKFACWGWKTFEKDSTGARSVQATSSSDVITGSVDLALQRYVSTISSAYYTTVPITSTGEASECCSESLKWAGEELFDGILGARSACSSNLSKIKRSSRLVDKLVEQGRNPYAEHYLTTCCRVTRGYLSQRPFEFTQRVFSFSGQWKHSAKRIWPISTSYNDGLVLLNQGNEERAVSRLLDSAWRMSLAIELVCSYSLTEILHLAVAPYWIRYDHFRSATFKFLERTVCETLGTSHPFTRIVRCVNQLSYVQFIQLLPCVINALSLTIPIRRINEIPSGRIVQANNIEDLDEDTCEIEDHHGPYPSDSAQKSAHSSAFNYPTYV